MPVMTDEEARAAGLQEKLEAAETARAAARERSEAAQEEYLAASEAWIRAADEPDSERGQRARAARESARQGLDRAVPELERAEQAYFRAFVARHGGRVDFDDAPDEWAELETRPTHEQYVKLRKAAGRVQAAGAGDVEVMLDEVGKIVAVLLKAWRVLDRDGAELPLTADGLRRCPWDRMRPIYERAMAIHRSIPDPNR